MHKKFIIILYIFIAQATHNSRVFSMATLKDFATHELFYACKEHDSKKVKAALVLGAEVNDYDSHGFTPLLYACQFNYPLWMPSFLIAQALNRQERIVLMLLNAGAQVNQSSLDKVYTPLWFAVYGIDYSKPLFNKRLVCLLERFKALDDRVSNDLIVRGKNLADVSPLKNYNKNSLSFFEILSQVVYCDY